MKLGLTRKDESVSITQRLFNYYLVPININIYHIFRYGRISG